MVAGIVGEEKEGLKREIRGCERLVSPGAERRTRKRLRNLTGRETVRKENEMTGAALKPKKGKTVVFLRRPVVDTPLTPVDCILSSFSVCPLFFFCSL